MSEASLQESVSVESLVAQVADEFMARQRNGERPDIEEYAARYPQAAELLRNVLAALDVIGLSQPSSAIVVDSGEPTGTLGDFRILREVGRGGMGVVYEAEQISLGRRVALKVLPFAATMDPRHLQRFHNEARAAASLHHTNIVPVHAVGCERGVHFYAMQFIDGQSLDAFLRQQRKEVVTATSEDANRTTDYRGSPAIGTTVDTRAKATTNPLPSDAAYFRRIAEWGIAAAEALEHAHGMGIVHRDVKPANLLIDGNGRLWVTDFGLARMGTEGNLTLTGDLLGTLRYMSPEQALAKHGLVGYRTDVYSLGVTLYELLTLRPAVEGDNREELLRKIAMEEPIAPRRWNKAIPAELEIIVQKAMAKEISERYATAQELADDLRHWLEDKPIRARRPSLRTRLGRWSRRHKPLVAAVLAALLMGVAVLAGGIGWVASERSMRREAVSQIIADALKQSASFQAERRLPEALSAARRAEGLLAGADVDAALQQRVRARLADLQLLENLENARQEQILAVKEGRFDREGSDRLYGRIFRESGMDLEALSAEGAAERIAGTSVAVELAAVLDEWAAVREIVAQKDNPSWKVFLRIACLVDPDPLRTRVREAWQKEDWQTLRELATSKKVFDLPPAMLFNLGSILQGDPKSRALVESFLLEAQRCYPNDFWLNYGLYWYYHDIAQPRRLEEAIRFATAAVVLRPGSPGAHVNLGVALQNKQLLDEAIAEYRTAIRLKPDYAEAHGDLGFALSRKGRLQEAFEELQKAIEQKKDHYPSYNNLGMVLVQMGRLDESIAACREAIRIKKDYPHAYVNLANALREKGRLEEAVAACRQALQIKKDNPEAHQGLGIALFGMGRPEEAIAEFREAIRIKEDSGAHNNLGLVYAAQGRLDEAITEYREAIRCDKENAQPHFNLGQLLHNQGRFAEARPLLKRGHELGSRNSHWSMPSAEAIRKCETLLELDGKLPAIVSGRKQPADTTERLALAWICQCPSKQRHASAARFYREAFADQPPIANDLDAQHRYNAACSAALAGCGKGNDADKLDPKERARLRQQALDWLKADLKAYRQVMDKAGDQAGPAIAQRMRHWLHDPDLASVREAKALEQLPESERAAWRKLWQQVEALRKDHP